MGKKLQEGFTLIELMVGLAVMGIVLSVGIPALGDLVASNRMATAVNDVVSSLYFARSEALKRRSSVTLCASSSWAIDAASCDPGGELLRGWIVFTDANADGVVDAGDTVLGRHGPVADPILSNSHSRADSPAPQYVSFRGDGRRQDLSGFPPGVQNVQLCDSRGNRDMGGVAAGRWISLSLAGRPSVAQTVAQLQDPGNPLGGC